MKYCECDEMTEKPFEQVLDQILGDQFTSKYVMHAIIQFCDRKRFDIARMLCHAYRGDDVVIDKLCEGMHNENLLFVIVMISAFFILLFVIVMLKRR